MGTIISEWHYRQDFRFVILNQFDRSAYLVVFEDSQLDLLLLVLVLLWGGVVLLLPFLGTTTKAEHQVECGLLLDVIVAQGATILQLLASKDQTLLIRRDTLQNTLSPLIIKYLPKALLLPVRDILALKEYMQGQSNELYHCKQLNLFQVFFRAKNAHLEIVCYDVSSCLNRHVAEWSDID